MKIYNYQKQINHKLIMKQISQNFSGGQGPGRIKTGRHLYLKQMLILLLMFVSSFVYADRWDGGYRVSWDAKKGAFILDIRFYDSTGRDDVLQNGTITLNGEAILEGLNETHHDYPYHLDMNTNTNGGKYRFEVKDGNGNWRLLGGSAQDVQYTFREDSGSGYFYYITIAVFPNYFKDTKDKEYNFRLKGKINRNSTLVEDVNVTHYFSCTPKIDYNTDIAFTTEWRNNKTLVLRWNESNKDYSKVRKLSVKIDGVTHDFENKTLANDITVNNYWSDKISYLMDNSCNIEVNAEVSPSASDYYRYEKDIEISSTAFGQPKELNCNFEPANSDGEPNTINVKWKMNEKYVGDFVVRDSFRIERTEKIDGKINTKKIGVKYVAGQEDYLYKDTDISSGGEPEYTYVLSRNSVKTGYPELKYDLTISTRHCSPDAINAVTNDNGDAVIVTWDDMDIIWTQGTKCTLTQTDLENMQTYEINIDEETYRKKTYTATRVKNCGSYEYKLELEPGDKDMYPVTYQVVTKEPVSPYKPGTIENISASKGYFTDRTEISWESYSAFNNFIIERKPYEAPDSEYKQIGSVTYENSLTNYSFDDHKGAVGTVYEYRVFGVIQCVDVKMYSVDTLYSVGFRSSTGNVSGRVTYTNGQAVEGVEILPQSDNMNNGKAVRFNGDGYIRTLKDLSLPSNGFTFETYVRPDKQVNSNMAVLSMGSRKILSFDSFGRAVFSLDSESLIDTTKYVADRYYHFSMVYDGNNMRLYTDSVLVAEKQIGALNFESDQMVIGAVAVSAGDGYEDYLYGYVDEVRVWNKALTENEIIRDYTRTLYGGETGLSLYYRFNEGVENEVYDVSFEGEFYHEMHSTSENVSYVSDPIYLPSFEQLAIKGITDINGNYTINGIPYASNGTQYRIIPRYGTHKFDPTERLFTMNENNRDFTADFTDNSSFRVSGRVLYSESTIPVEGVMFEIDGVRVSKDGQIVTSNSIGEFEISVPVGKHKVRAVLNNHTFRNDGYLLENGEDRFYNGVLEGVIFRDETRVRLIGRVAGGPVEQSYPLGHSLSTNNLGDNPTVRLQLSGSASNMFKIYADETGNDEDAEKNVAVQHFRPSYWGNDPDRVPESTQVKYTGDYIEVQPALGTGEFSVDLIPASYDVTSVKVTGHNDIIDGLMTLNAKDSLMVKYSEFEYVIPDSLRTKAGKDTIAIDSVPYNISAQFIKRVNPSMEVHQLSQSGELLDYYGDTIYVYNSIIGEIDTIPIFDTSKEGKERYLFGMPFMTQPKAYEIQTSLFEAYNYYKLQGGKPIEVPEREDKVPVTDAVVRFSNDIKALGTVDTVSVNNEGIALYRFMCGRPNLSSEDGSSKLEITAQVGDRTIEEKEIINAIVCGVVEGNNNFVTAGPDIITAVLRDPPGSNSYSFFEEGTSFESFTTTTSSLNFSQEIGKELSAAAKITTSVGMGTTVDTSIKLGEETSFTAFLEENADFIDGLVSRITTTNRWQTSDDPAYVGADADVYIGKSTNVIIGPANSVEIVRNGEFNPDYVDRVIAAGNGYSLIQRESVNIGVSFETMFAYPQIHIESVLIPQLKNLMKAQFSNEFAYDKEAAQAKADREQKIVYTTTLSPEDEDFGEDGTYDVFIPCNPGDKTPGQIYSSNPEHSNLDTIMTLRQSIENWENAIRDNELKKLTASKDKENLSFHAGASVERTLEFAGTDVYSRPFSIVTGAHQLFKFESTVNEAGVRTNLDLIETITKGFEEGHNNEESRSFGFVLAEDGTDYISVDVVKVDNNEKVKEIVEKAEKDLSEGSITVDEYYTIISKVDAINGSQDEYVFITRGGATSCPWEAGSVSKYYKPGTQIDQPTAQMEKPVLTVEENTVTNVPSARRAVFKLRLGNESETGDDQYFMLSQIDASNPDGAKFYIDGTPLGDGRVFLVPAGGEPLIKTLEVEKGASLVYKDLQLCLHSMCQYDPTGFQDLIESTVNLNVEFVPSCTDLVLASPLDQWVLNSNSPNRTEDGKYYIPVKVNEFDPNYEYFHHIDIQFKGSSESDDKWVTKARFYKAEEDMNADISATCEKFVIEGAEVNYNIVLDEKIDVDRSYDICAVSACRLENEFIQTISNIARGIKDTYRPRLFGQPQPADGVLGVEDEIRLNFNESIASGYITADNISAMGVRVGTENTNNASVSFDGVSEYAMSDLSRNFTGKSFTIEANVLFDEYKEAVLFAMGNENMPFEMGFDQEGYLVVTVGKTTLRAHEPVDKELKGQWQHVAVVYENQDIPRVTGYVDLKEVLPPTKVDAYTGIGCYVIGCGLDNSRYFHGKLNEFRIWTTPVTLALLNKNRGKMLSGAEANLLNYYPMTEGRGSLLEDKAGGNHIALHASWYVDNIGYSAYFIGDACLKYPASTVIVSDEMDYTVEFWFKSESGLNSNAALLSNGKANSEDNNMGEKHIYIGFEDGKLITRNNGYTHVIDEDFRDGSWHHYALTVSRSMDKASVYIDGNLKGWFSAANFDGISAEYLTLGACCWIPNDGMGGIGGNETTDDYFFGRMDEVRLWNVALNETLVNRYCNTRRTGGEDGLMIYLPFEEAVRDIDNNIVNMNYYINNLANNDWYNLAPENSGILKSEDAAGIKDVTLETNIEVEAVVNNDAIILTPKQGINEWNNFEQQIVTFTVKDIQDLNGNRLESPVVWTAFIDRNHLKWSDTELFIECDLYEGADFDVDIINIGGMNQGYSLQGVPSWLEVSAESDIIAPKGSETLHFHVSEALNVGTYDQVIYMLNDNGVARALNLVVKVNGETPDWSVNPSDYQYTMSVYGKMKVNNIYSDDEEDMLAAFHNGKCVGVAYNTYAKEYDMWYSLLTVYSNEPTHDELEFRIWDASTGTIYLGEPSKHIVFRNDIIEGTPVSPVIFETRDMRLQNIMLNAGWNWISFNVSNDRNQFKRLFSLGNWTEGDMVKDETNSTFASYSAVDGWTGPMSESEVSYKNMYLVNTAESQMLTMSGTPLETVDERTVPVHQYWNYIAFLPTLNMTVQEALAGYEASEGDIVKDQSSFAMYSEPIGWLGSLQYMKPGVGYMFYRVNEGDSEIVYPMLSSNTSQKLLVKSAPAKSVSYGYPSNMSVVATVNGNCAEDGDRIVAWADGEIRGISEPVYDSERKCTLHYLTIEGDKPVELTLSLNRNGEIIDESDDRIEFAPDAVLGNVRNPYPISFNDILEGAVYPSLFNDKLNIRLFADDAEKVVISLVDMTGRVIRMYDNINPDNGGLVMSIDNLGEIASGIYFVDIRIDGKSNIFKVEKK